MKPTLIPRYRRTDVGFISVEFLGAVLLSMIIFMFLANFIFVQYGSGVVRAAADEGARAGARVDDTAIARCQDRAKSTLENGMGSLGSNVTWSCALSADGTRVLATTHADFEAWFPGFPSFERTSTASAVKEQAPQ